MTDGSPLHFVWTTARGAFIRGQRMRGLNIYVWGVRQGMNAGELMLARVVCRALDPERVRVSGVRRPG